MRILLLLFVSIQFAFSQDDPLFKIVSCSEGVTLDGNEVIPGQIVYSNSIKLEIPKKGYVGIITAGGLAAEIRMTIKVKLVNKKFGKYSLILLEDEVGFHGTFNNSRIYGDSLFVGIYDKTRIGAPYQVIFLNFYDDVLKRDTLRKNWEVYALDEVLNKDTSVLVNVQSIFKPNERNLRGAVRRLRFEPPRLKYDLSRAPDEVSIAAIFELNNLYYDHIFQLYKIRKDNSNSIDKISQAYLSQRVEHYQFDQYNFTHK